MFNAKHIFCCIKLVYLPFACKTVYGMLVRFVTFVFILLIATDLFSQKYRKIHDAAVLIDTHNDFPSASIEKKVSFDAELLGKTHSDLARMRAGGVDVQIFSIFCGP